MLIDYIRDAINRAMIESGVRPSYVKASPLTYERLFQEYYSSSRIVNEIPGHRQIILDGIHVYSDFIISDTMVYIYSNHNTNAYPLPQIGSSSIFDNISSVEHSFLRNMSKKTKPKRNLPEWW